MCSTVVKLRLWRSSRADGADDLIAEFDHHTAAEAHHMRQLVGSASERSKKGITVLLGSAAS
jgi:hypothetical protein